MMQIDTTNIILKTPRFVLRAPLLSDLNDFYEYCKVDGVGELAGWIHHSDIKVSEMILNSFLQNKNIFAITLNNKMIGSIGIEPKIIDEFSQKGLNGRELGYVLSKDYWGQGIMKECVDAVCDWLFNQINLDYLAIVYYKRNNQSKRVSEKCGFTYYKDTICHTRYETDEPSIITIKMKKDF
jgi:ribosomal-protein-alanine N-acetyltransferase